MIRYTLPASGRVAVRVYNILGQVVATWLTELRMQERMTFHSMLPPLQRRLFLPDRKAAPSRSEEDDVVEITSAIARLTANKYTKLPAPGGVKKKSPLAMRGQGTQREFTQKTCRRFALLIGADVNVRIQEEEMHEGIGYAIAVLAFCLLPMAHLKAQVPK